MNEMNFKCFITFESVGHFLVSKVFCEIFKNYKHIVNINSLVTYSACQNLLNVWNIIVLFMLSNEKDIQLFFNLHYLPYYFVVFGRGKKLNSTLFEIW